ncbi:hypothetical protein BDR05DRAFT_952981 [Suillus weaverae]|nr:hypothetical protein BDR05DRAFT_952981 [Suillus weaverae]
MTKSGLCSGIQHSHTSGIKTETSSELLEPRPWKRRLLRVAQRVLDCDGVRIQGVWRRFLVPPCAGAGVTTLQCLVPKWRATPAAVIRCMETRVSPIPVEAGSPEITMTMTGTALGKLPVLRLPQNEGGNGVKDSDDFENYCRNTKQMSARSQKNDRMQSWRVTPVKCGPPSAVHHELQRTSPPCRERSVTVFAAIDKYGLLRLLMFIAAHTHLDLFDPVETADFGLESMERQDESGETTWYGPANRWRMKMKVVRIPVFIVALTHPYLFGTVELLNFGLGPPPFHGESGRFVIEMDGSEPLDFGLGSPSIHHGGQRFAYFLFPASTSFKFLGTDRLVFCMLQSPPLLGDYTPAVTETFTSGKCITSSLAPRHDDHTGGSEHRQASNQPYMSRCTTHVPPIHPTRSAPPTSCESELLPTSQYGTFPPWTSAPSLFPAITQFNREYRNEEPRVEYLSGTPPDHLIPGSPSLHVGNQPSSPPHRLLPDNALHLLPPGLEDPHKSLSDEELLKMCHSMRLGVLSEDEFTYARRLLTEVVRGDNERDIAPPTLQDIVEADHPFHMAHLQASATFRKRIQDLQRAVRIHDKTQQLRDQVQAMLDSAERMEHFFKGC